MTEILASTPWLLVATVFVLSLLVGSFLNVVIHRLPIMLDRQWRAQAEEMLGAAHGPAAGAVPGATERYNLVVPRSRCPKCDAEIKAHQNIPVVSYLLLGGKCAQCKCRDLAALPDRRTGDGVPVRRRRLALRLALADARGARLHLGAGRARR